MMGSVLFVHYTPPGVVGGVESLLQQHADLLMARGYRVSVAAGRESPSNVPLTVIPELNVASDGAMQIEQTLAGGVVDDRFQRARTAIADRLGPLLEAADHVIVHNAFTLHFSLPLTAALWDAASASPHDKFIAWCHDLSWTNPLYIPTMHPGYPWDLLRTRHPRVTYVTVSGEHQIELCGLWGGECDAIHVVPNGIDPDRFFALSEEAKSIVSRHCLYDRDVVLLLPVRVTRRKNIEAGIRVTAAIRDRGVDACFLVSGPQAPHHPGRSSDYLAELKNLRSSLGLDGHVAFLADDLGGPLDVATVPELYQLCDALLFLSAQEGFGLPVLEAGLRHVPVILSDIPIFREVADDAGIHLKLDETADRMATAVLDALSAPASRLFRRVLKEYRWDVIVDSKIEPLLQGGRGG